MAASKPVAWFLLLVIGVGGQFVGGNYDGLSPAFMVMNRNEVWKFCAAHEETAAYIVNQAGEMIHLRGEQ